MRDIKFRAWDKVEKEMFSVRELLWMHVMLVGRSGQPQRYGTGECVLMQYAGLNDKAEKPQEIYEGDKIKDFLDGKEGVIEFLDGSFCIVGVEKYAVGLLEYLENSSSSTEIIGNIYE